MRPLAPRWIIVSASGGLVALLLIFLFAPRPLEVDAAPVRRGPIETAVSDQGIARVREAFVVSTPVTGRVERIGLEVGDPVVAGVTVVARVRPAAADLLDPRARAQAQASVAAAEAAVEAARSDRARLAAEADRAARDFKRTQGLAGAGAVSLQDLENARAAASGAGSALAAADAQVRARAAELRRAVSSLLGPDAPSRQSVAVTAPASGVVTRVLQESERVVAAGTPLVEVGVNGGLEAQIEFLSQDAVNIRPGMRAEVYDWGGPRPIPAVVRRVEPQGYAKVSALGVEEQRVLVMLRLLGGDDAAARLGPGYRLWARVVLRRSDQADLAPLGALVRDAGGWAVFRIEHGRARLRRVEVGAMNDTDAEILRGLKAGDQLVVYPSDKVRPGRWLRPNRP